MNKKKLIFSGVLALTTLVNVKASVYYESFNVTGGTIAAAPIDTVFSGSLSGIPTGETISGLTVSLNVSGGYNGSVYAYLVSPNGGPTFLLINQPGVSENANFGNGYDGSGFNVTLSDAAPSSIQTTSEPDGTVFSGTYSAAGSLSGLNGLDGSVADGTWKLNFADKDSAPVTTLTSWSLDITTVPEPVTQALIIFGAVSLLIHFGRWCWTRLHNRRLR